MQRRTFLEAGLTTVGASLAVGVTGGTQSEAFGPIGSVDVEGATEAVFHPTDDSTVYVAAGDGLVTVDIAGGSPEIRSEDRDLETPGGDQMGLLWDLWTWDDRLIIAGPAESVGGYGTGFALYDISAPSNPELLTVYDAELPAIHNASFDDGVVYLTGSSTPDQPVVMVDVEDDDPTEVGRFSILDHEPSWGDLDSQLRLLHDVHVHDGIAYLPQWDAGAWIVDVSDPGSPAVLSRTGEYSLSELQALEGTETFVESFTPPGNAHVTTVDEEATVMAVGEEAWAVPNQGGDGTVGGPGGVRLYDVSDKTDPRALATIEPPPSDGQTQSDQFTTAHNVDIVGDRLYTSWYFGGVKIHDISDPARPEEISWWREPSEAVFWTAQAAGDSVAATSVDIQSLLGSSQATREALYVFPDEAGSQQTGSGTPDDSDGGDASGESSSDDGDDADDSGPGFGIGSALLAAGTAGYALARRRRDEN